MRRSMILSLAMIQAMALEACAPAATTSVPDLAARPLEPLTNLAALAQAGYANIIVMDASRERRRKTMTGMWNDKTGRYDLYTNGVSKYWLVADESPAVTERLEKLVNQVEDALPGVFALTNQVSGVLTNVESLSSNLNWVALAVRPAVSNLAAATAHLDRPGGLGEWLLPTNLNSGLEASLTNASAILAAANTNLAVLAQNLNRSLDNLASITGGLSNQGTRNRMRGSSSSARARTCRRSGSATTCNSSPQTTAASSGAATTAWRRCSSVSRFTVQCCFIISGAGR